MKLSILGVEYDYMAAINKAKLSDLYDLKLASGVGPRAVMAMFKRVNAAKTPDEAAEVYEEADSLAAFAGLVFLCRRFGGEKVSYEDSQVSFADIIWVEEPSDEAEGEADPTTASGDPTPPDAETTNDEQPSKPARKRSSSPAT